MHRGKVDNRKVGKAIAGNAPQKRPDIGILTADKQTLRQEELLVITEIFQDGERDHPQKNKYSVCMNLLTIPQKFGSSNDITKKRNRQGLPWRPSG